MTAPHWQDEFFILPHSDGSGDIAISHWHDNEPCPEKWESRISERTLNQIRQKAHEHYGECSRPRGR